MKAEPMIVYLPDTRGVELSRYGCGNMKLGLGVFTYSRLAGGETGTCPGSTEECEAICYAKRTRGVVRDEVYIQNTVRDDVPPIPATCSILRIHVSGDFDTVDYIQSWITRLTERPDVTCWAYTRSWRVPELLFDLEQLRSLPNMQLFASMDPSTPDVPPVGWRRAWIWRDAPNGHWPMESRLTFIDAKLFDSHNQITFDGGRSYVCPEETGRKADCLSCGYCFEGQKHDVTFLEHGGTK